MMLEITKREIGILRALSAGAMPPEVDERSGICAAAGYSDLGSIFKAWPEYSGRVDYPVPDEYGASSPQNAYSNARWCNRLWDNTTGYGRSRRRLAGFIADHYEYKGSEWARAIAALRYLLKEGPRNTTLGICFNFASLTAMGGSEALTELAYKVSSALAEGWAAHSGSDACFIPGHSGEKWEDEGLTLRNSAMRHMLKRARLFMRTGIPYPTLSS